MELTETTRRELWRKVDVGQKGRLLFLAVGVRTLEDLLKVEHHLQGVVRGLQVSNANLRASNEALQEEVERLRFALNITADVGQIAMCQKHVLRSAVERMAEELRRIASGHRVHNRLAESAHEGPTLREH